MPGCTNELDFEFLFFDDEKIRAVGILVKALDHVLSHFAESLLIYLWVLGRDSLTLLEENLEVLEVILQNIFAPINVGLTLEESFWLKVVSLLLSLLPVRRRVVVVSRVLAFNVITEPLFENVWQGDA